MYVRSHCGPSQFWAKFVPVEASVSGSCSTKTNDASSTVVVTTAVSAILRITWSTGYPNSVFTNDCAYTFTANTPVTTAAAAAADTTNTPTSAAETFGGAAVKLPTATAATRTSAPAADISTIADVDISSTIWESSTPFE